MGNLALGTSLDFLHLLSSRVLYNILATGFIYSLDPVNAQTCLVELKTPWIGMTEKE